MKSNYETDFHAWAEEQEAALRARGAESVGWDNIAEEIGSLARNQLPGERTGQGLR